MRRRCSATRFRRPSTLAAQRAPLRGRLPRAASAPASAAACGRWSSVQRAAPFAARWRRRPSSPRRDRRWWSSTDNSWRTRRPSQQNDTNGRLTTRSTAAHVRVAGCHRHNRYQQESPDARNAAQRRETRAPDVRAEPGVQPCRGGGAHVGHRRQHRHLLGRQRDPAQAGRGAGSRPGRGLHERVATRLRSGGVAGEVRALRAADRSRPGCVGVQHGRHELHGRQLPRAAAVRARLRRFLQAHWRAVAARSQLHGRRGSSRRSARRGHRATALGDPVQRRPEHRRQDDFARRRAVHHRRRARAGRLPRVRSDASGLGALPVRSEHDRPGTLLPGARPIEARRHAAAGERQAAGVGQGFPRQVPDGHRPAGQLRRADDPRRDRPRRRQVVAHGATAAPSASSC